MPDDGRDESWAAWYDSADCQKDQSDRPKNMITESEHPFDPAGAGGEHTRRILSRKELDSVAFVGRTAVFSISLSPRDPAKDPTVCFAVTSPSGRISVEEVTKTQLARL